MDDSAADVEMSDAEAAGYLSGVVGYSVNVRSRTAEGVRARHCRSEARPKPETHGTHGIHL